MATTLIGIPGDDPNDRKTKLIGPGGGTRVVQPDAANEPVVAWLVVADGPGQGRSVELSYGMNTIGRGVQNRVQLDFGDSKISEDDHFRIVYDGANRDFHIVAGRGRNLVYLDGKPLLDAQRLPGACEFQIGDTTLRFVPLCGKDWDWEQRAPSRPQT